MPAATNIAILCRDNLLLRQYAALLRKSNDLRVSIQETCVDAFCSSSELKNVHVVLLMDLEAVEPVRGFLNISFPAIKIVCNCLFKTRHEVASVLKVNIRGIIFRDRVEAHELVQAIRNVASKGCDFQVLYRKFPEWHKELELYCRYLPTLSERQYEVLQLLASGMQTKEIAHVLCVDNRTVNRIIKSVRESVDACTDPEMIAKAIHYCWIPSDVALRQNGPVF